MNFPSSPIGQHQMELLMTIPLDWRRPKVRQAYNLFWCDTSQYGMLYPRPTAHEIAEFYDVADYYTHGKTIATSSRAQLKPSFLAWVLMRVSWQIDGSIYIDREWFRRHHGAQPARVLDIGCGSGKILAELRADGHDVLGIEPDPIAREVARSRGIPVLDGTAENIPTELSGERFDAVIMTHVLEHTFDPLQALRNAQRLLVSGGKLTVETPNNAALGFEQAGSVWRWLDVPRHLNFFTPTSLQSMCTLAGLRSDTIEFRGYSRQFHPDWILDEQRIWDRYNAARHIKTPLPRRNSQSQAWNLFRQTAFAPADKKYDSVRVIAINS